MTGEVGSLKKDAGGLLWKLIEYAIDRIADRTADRVADILLTKIQNSRTPTKQMNKQEAIEYLPGVSRELFEEICKKHKIGVKVGTRWIYTNTELDKLIEEHKGKALI